ncbi:thiamine pyrophosphate-binding protein [Afipia sp. GAS231]|uniref:thiamine pyrophosphate-binding protein n=1 Tax=Afipia sp. GAS231 TaxID=1882747 RepID=UPI000B80368E|nr:thiamine pyrophosphate-binding protein [Afipia sp. GAS231]
MSAIEHPVAAALVKGALQANVEACVYLPDSGLTHIIRAFQAQPGLTIVPCAREDEGVGIAVGLQLGGRRTICFMEASGLGFSGLILARAQVQRTPVVVIASHTRGGGEQFDYHGATIRVSDGIFRGLEIPFEVATEQTALDLALFRIIQTAQSQRTCFGLLLPPYVAAGI